MGTIYQRTDSYCTTCRPGGKRLARTADRRGCEAAGHTIEERTSPIYWVKYSRNGKSYAESSESKLKGNAQRLLRRIEGKIEDGKPHTPKMNRFTFDDAANDLLADYSINRKRSVDCVERRVKKHLTPFFEGWRMSDITTTSIRQYIAERQTKPSVLVRKAYTVTEPDGTVREVPEERRPASNAEINRELAALKRMFSLAVQAGTLAHRPHIPMLKENNIRTGFFEEAQLQAVLRHLPAEVRPVIEMASITGWRIASEILPLEWRRVDFDGGEVRLDAGTTKNGEARTFPLTDDLRTLLEGQKAEHERLKKAGHIFPLVFFREGEDGKPRAVASFKKAWRSACKMAGCPGRIPHDLRRTAVRNFVRRGISTHVAMRLSGHKTESVFRRYDIVSGSDYTDAASRLNDTKRGGRKKTAS